MPELPRIGDTAAAEIPLEANSQAIEFKAKFSP